MNERATAALALLAASMLAATARAAPPPAEPKPEVHDSCFYVNQIQSNRPLGDQAVIFRVDGAALYRLDFADRCAMLTVPDPKLIITPFGGSELICHAIDFDIKVSDQGPGAIAEPCIPTSLHRMTPAEVAALPKKSVP